MFYYMYLNLLIIKLLTIIKNISAYDFLDCHKKTRAIQSDQYQRPLIV